MIILKTLDNHAAIEQSEDIKTICQPLFDHTLINYLNYVRVFFDGKRLSVGTKPDWLEHYFNEQYQNITCFNNDSNCLDNRFMLHGSHLDNKAVKDATENYNIGYGFTLITHCEKYMEYFHFATDRNNHQAMEFYMNNINLLERFSLYFLEASKDIIESIKPYVPENKASLQTLVTPEDNSQKIISLDEFLKATAVKKIHCKYKEGEFFLTTKEARCINLHMQGLTSKEIAKLIFLSHRTVEYYLNNIKKKLNVKSRLELFYFFKKNKLMHLLDCNSLVGRSKVSKRKLQ